MTTMTIDRVLYVFQTYPDGQTCYIEQQLPELTDPIRMGMIGLDMIEHLRYLAGMKGREIVVPDLHWDMCLLLPEEVLQ